MMKLAQIGRLDSKRFSTLGKNNTTKCYNIPCNCIESSDSTLPIVPNPNLRKKVYPTQLKQKYVLHKLFCKTNLDKSQILLVFHNYAKMEKEIQR